MHSALSIPLGDGVEQLSGALTLYRTEKDAYSADHLRVLLAIKGDIARAVDGAIRFQKAQQGTGADELTGLPTRAALLAYLQDGFAAQRKAGDGSAVRYRGISPGERVVWASYRG